MNVKTTRTSRWILGVFGLVTLGLGLSISAGLIRDEPVRTVKRLYQQGSHREAALQARKLLAKRPDDSELLRWLARAESRLGRNQAARSLYQRLHPDQLQAEDFFLVSAGLIAEGQYKDARFGLVRALELQPDLAEARAVLTRFDRKNDRLVEAASQAELLSRSSGWSAQAALLLGLVRLDQRQPAAAAAALQKALTLDPRLAGSEEGSPEEIRKLLARCLLQSGRAAEAVAPLDEVLAKHSGDREAHWLRSRALLRSGDVLNANEALSLAGEYGDDAPETPEPAEYVGIARCAQCHPAIVRSQQNSRHAQTFHRQGDLNTLPLPNKPRPDPDGSKVTHSLTREGGDVRFRVEGVEGEQLQAIAKYMMGSGDRAITLVGRDQAGKWCELRVSYYGPIKDWDRTTGHPFQPVKPAEYLGQPLDDDAVRRCLSCHTTRARIGEAGDIEADEVGFSCERCHGPAGNHLAAVDSGFPDRPGGFREPAIARPRLASVTKVNSLCGQCHGAQGRGIDLSDPNLPRFQATSLPLSKCRTDDGQVLGCLNCHNPHQNAETSARVHEGKCLSCHDGTPGSNKSESRPGATFCPVNRAGDCLSCHMPKVKTPVPHVTFTDHHIRILTREERSLLGESRSESNSKSCPTPP